MGTTTVMSDRKVCLTCKKWGGKRRSYPRKGSKGSLRIEAEESSLGYCSHFGTRTDPLYGCPHYAKAKF